MKTKKLIALLLSLVMVVGLLPAFALPAAATTSISCYFAADNPSMDGSTYSTYSFGAIMPIRAVKVTWFSLTALAEAAGVTPTFTETENQITAAHVAVQAVRDQVKNQDINPFDAQYADYISMNAAGKIVSLLGTPLAIDETLAAKALSPVVYWSLNSTSYGTTANEYNPTLVSAVDGELMLLTRRFVNSKADGLVVYVNHFDSLKKIIDSNDPVTLTHSQYNATKQYNQPKDCTTYKHKVYWLNPEGNYIDVTSDSTYCTLPTNGTGDTAVPSIDFTYTFHKDGYYAVYAYNDKGTSYNAVGSWCLVNCNVPEGEVVEDPKLDVAALNEAISGATDLVWNGALGTMKKPANWNSYYDPLVTASNTSPKTYGPWQRELKAAQALLEEVCPGGVAADYDEEQQAAIEAQATALTAATAALDRLAVEGEDGTHDDRIKGEVALNGINLYTKTLYPKTAENQAKYTPASWQTFAEATDAALAAIEGASIQAGIGVKESRNYYTLFNALRAACYGLVDKDKDTITVHFSAVDNYALHKNEDWQKVNTTDLTLPAGATIADALAAADVAFSRGSLQEIYCAVGYYINEMHLQTVPGYNQYQNEQNTATAKLRDGDTLLAVREQPAIRTNMSGAQELDYTAASAYFTVTAATTEAEAGAAFTVSATETGAEPGNRKSSSAPLAGAAVYVSAAQESEAAARKAPLTQDTGFVTDKNGNATVKLYSEGWYGLNVFNTGSKGGASTGPTILVHITAASDLSQVKAELKAELETLAGKYGKDFFKDADWTALNEALDAALPAIANAASSTEAYDAQHSAVLAIQALHEKAEYYNEENLEYFRKGLDALPDDLDKLDASYAGWRIDNVIRRYGDMTAYQHGQLTAAEEQKYLAIVAAYEAGLTEAKTYQVIVSNVVVGGDADRAAVQDMMDWLAANTATDDAGAALAAWGTPYTYEYSPQLYKDVLTAYPDGLNANTGNVHICASPVYPAYFHLRDNTLPTDKAWSIGAGTLHMNSYGSITTLTGDLSYTINGKAYEIREVTISEGSAQQTNVPVTDNSSYLGKATGTKTLNVHHAFYILTMPPEDVTLTLTWGPVGGSDAELAEAKEAAKAAVTATFNGYDEADYSDANWTKLTGIYHSAVDDGGTIDRATTVEEVASARKAAISGMAAVKKEKSNNSGVPDFGDVVGQVYVSVRNDTFPGGSWTGPIVPGGWYDLCEDDSMMTCALKALAANGFAWTGTGGEGYDITYLSSIYQDANGNGEWDRGTEKKLGEFDGEPGSGWMGMLNDWFVNEGLDMFKVANGKLENGDVIEIVYTQNLGVDLHGTWGNSDTSLMELKVEGGTLTPTFDGGLLQYTLIISGERAGVKVTPHASNRNYLVKTFLNTYNSDAAFYRRTDTISVKPGDVLYIGVGEKGWPSMNNQGAEARAYTGTKYTITVYAGGTAGVEARIADAYKDQNKITYSNYKKYAAIVAQLREDYDALPNQSEVGNYDKLEALEKKIKFFEEIDAVKALLAALPKSANMSDAQVTAAKAQIEAAYAAYDKLSEEQRGYITVGDAKNYNELVDRLKELTPTTSAQTITGSDKKPEKDENEIAPAQVAVAPEVVNGEAKAEISAEDVSKAIEEAPDAKTLTVKVETEGAARVEADLPADAVRVAADAGMGVNVETENGTVKLSAADVKAASGKDLAVSVKSNADGSTTLNVTSGGKTVDADVKVELPAAKDGQVLVIVDAEGNETVVKKSVEADGKVYAEIPAGSTVKVVDAEGGEFGDVKASDWFAGAVEFVTSHGLFQGTGEGFAPNVTMNRAMLVTVLYRLEDASASGGSSFGDVDAGAWYADAAAWANENGIVTGTDKGFEPDAPVTREQIATMLYRFVKALGLDVSASADLSTFPDGGATSDWAKDAMAWAAGVGLFKGDDTGSLNPAGNATRAEVATLIERLVGLLVK